VMWHNGWGAGSWLVLSLMMVIFSVLAVAGVVWLVRRRGQRQTTEPPDARRTLE